MLFDRKDSQPNERILYKTKPNMVLGCKKAIYGAVLLVIVLILSPKVIQFIGEMQVYMISQVKLPLTRYAAIAFFVIILVIAIYIIWQLIGWYSMEYTLTSSRIIIKSGVLSTKRNYMPYATIQDVNTSQNILQRLLNIGSVSVFSAYDNNQIELKNISNPSEVEEIIFSNIVGPRSFRPQANPSHQIRRQNYENDYYSQDDYYDEFEPITPIGHERDVSRREYDYYPENLDFEDNNPNRRYEYEPYDNSFERNVDNIVDDLEHDSYHQNGYYNRGMDDYYGQSQDYYEDINQESYYDERDNQSLEIDPSDIDSSEQVIRRHFDKFKK